MEMFSNKPTETNGKKTAQVITWFKNIKRKKTSSFCKGRC